MTFNIEKNIPFKKKSITNDIIIDDVLLSNLKFIKDPNKIIQNYAIYNFYKNIISQNQINDQINDLLKDNTNILTNDIINKLSKNIIINNLLNNYIINNLLQEYKHNKTIKNLENIIGYYIIIKNDLNLAFKYINKEQIDIENNKYILFLLAYYYMFININYNKMIKYSLKSIKKGTFKICYYLGYYFYSKNIKLAIYFLNKNTKCVYCLYFLIKIYNKINNIELSNKYTLLLLNNNNFNNMEELADQFNKKKINNTLMIKIYKKLILTNKSVTALVKLINYYYYYKDYDNMILICEENINEFNKICSYILINHYYNFNDEINLLKYFVFDYNYNNNQNMYIIIKYYLKHKNYEKINKYSNLALLKQDELSCFEIALYFIQILDFNNAIDFLIVAANKNHIDSIIKLVLFNYNFNFNIDILITAANNNNLNAIIALYQFFKNNNNNNEADKYLTMASKLNPDINNLYIEKNNLILESYIIDNNNIIIRPILFKNLNTHIFFESLENNYYKIEYLIKQDIENAIYIPTDEIINNETKILLINKIIDNYNNNLINDSLNLCETIILKKNIQLLVTNTIFNDYLTITINNLFSKFKTSILNEYIK